MQNMIIRKKIGSFGGFLEKNLAEYLPIFLLLTCYVLGFAIGYNGSQNMNSDETDRISQMFFSAPEKQFLPLAVSFYASVAVLTVLFGLSVCGFITVPVLTSFFGVACGYEMEIGRVLFAGKTYVIMIAGILPAISFFGAILIRYGKTASLLSYEIYGAFLHKSPGKPNRVDLRSYLSAGAAVLLSANVCSVAHYLALKIAMNF